jgi:site-specific recombinase XerD
VFIRADAPHVQLSGSPVISCMVMHAIKKAGVAAPRTGAHVFRHSLATAMLKRGASLDEIGQVLRHRDPDTTAIYAKVELEALRPLALPWPGGVR